MSGTVPGKVIRNIIADILFERANYIDDISDEKIKHEEKTIGYYTESTGEIGWTACGTRVLSDDIREGIIPLEEAIETLTPFERKAAKRKCEEWLNKRQKNLER